MEIASTEGGENTLYRVPMSVVLFGVSPRRAVRRRAATRLCIRPAVRHKEFGVYSLER
ncbi:hypothetical protein [Nocardia terpenica]|uniref:Uncharacterized protein n=1 Tax=Nocardia terpenica TaxID=455432 RepID=A0A6G9Z9A0_9NOCA|nr:hypothetical protein [Nocardia terpenica]QIS21593.1 hypothetical protein F6W96_27900 [Nocardia terpenica]